MKSLLLLFTSLIAAISLAAPGLSAGAVFGPDLKHAVETATFEVVTSEMEIDFNFDGKNESAFGVTCGNAGCEYFLFEQVAEDKFKFIGNLFFHPKGVSIDPKSKSMSVYIRSSAMEGCVQKYNLSRENFLMKIGQCK